MARLRRDDVELRFERTGRGAPVVFIQGVGVTGEGWRPQVAGVVGAVEALTFDNRGLGGSVPCAGPITIEAMAGDVLALLDAAGWPAAHLVGHSLGGVVAQQVALQAPARVRSLALLCTFARGSDATRLSRRMAWLGLRTRLGSRRMRRRAFLEMVFSPGFLAQSDPDRLAARCAALFGRDLADSPPILMRQLRALGRHDVSARLVELLRIPAMVLSGELDPVAPVATGRELARRLGVEHEVVPGVSHALTIERADFVNARLLEFWRGTAAGRTMELRGGSSRAGLRPPAR